MEEELDGMEIVETLSKRPHRVEGRVDDVEREQRDDGIRGPRHKTKARGRDDGERAFAATQQTREVVSGVVLVETFETPQYPSVGEDGFDACDLTPGGPVPQHVHPAGVRSDHPANGRRVTRREVDAVLPSRRRRVRLQLNGLRILGMVNWLV